MRMLKWLVLLVFPILASCAQTETPAMTPSITASHKPTATSMPTNTNTPVPTQTPTPTPVPPAFSGRLLALDGEVLFELSASTDSPQVNYTLIASNVYDAAISPDFRSVVYSSYANDASPFGTHLYDLENQTDVVILPYRTDYIHWSPDSQRFSYNAAPGSKVTYDLYVYEVASNASRLVYEPPCAKYGYGPPINKTRQVCGELSGISWVTSNVGVFQRFKGAMPQEIYMYYVPANTTTLLFVTDGSQALVDSPRRWLLQDSCSDQVLLREETDEGTSFSISDTTEFTKHPGSIEPTPIRSCSEETKDCVSLDSDLIADLPSSQDVGFLPNSCNLFYFSRISSHDILFHILDPVTRADRSLSFPTGLGGIAFPSDFTWTAGWPDSPDTKIAVMSHYSSRIKIEIVNVQATKTSIIWEEENPKILFNSPKILGWIVP